MTAHDATAPSGRTGRAGRYTAGAIAFHWTLAVLILGLIAAGKYMTGLPPGSSEQFQLYQLHKSLGILVLLLTLGRIAWRVAHPPPPLPDGMKAWERAAARGTHLGFYALMLAIPLTGWAMVSASPWNIPTVLFGVVPWPHLPVLSGLDPAAKEATAGAFAGAHELLANLTLLLVVLHVAAALVHHFAKGDDVLARMLPLLRPRGRG